MRSLIVLSVMLGMILSSSGPIFAAGGQTGNVSGTIVDAKTGLPVAGASITVAAPTGTAHATSDARGFFNVLGLNVDTYTISIQAKGYDDQATTGVTVQGDQNVNLGTIKISKTLITIGSVRVRSASSVFQPTQTTDQYTISGNRILETTGKAASTDETALVQAVPGVSLTDTGNITIRGGLRTEVGYQLDGVDFTEPFFSNNSSNNRFNGLGSVQVVEGAGDATQGNIGGGVVNLVPKRGTYPGTGTVDFEVGGPNYYHQFNVEYGFATQNGRFSDYFSYNGQRDAPYNGYSNANAAAYNNFFAASYEKNDDLLNNFVFKFGKNNNQSLQILYENRNLQQYGDYGGATLTDYYFNDPGNPLVGSFLTPVDGVTPAQYQSLIGINKGSTLGSNPNNPEQIAANPTRFLKFEYDNNLDNNTFLQARYYNWETLQTSQNNTGDTGATPVSLGLGAYPIWQEVGGPRVGGTLDITHQFGSKNTITLSTKYETAHPIWDEQDPNALAFLLGATGQIADFLPNGYIAKQFPNGVPRIPTSGIDYNGAWYQTFGIGLREQYQPTDKLKFDLGVRVDGQNQNYGTNPFCTEAQCNGNPSDVSPANITRKYLDPREVEPRAAVNYQLDRNDALTFTYGRSVEFLNAQTSGTPAGMENAAQFLSIPATDTVATPACGTKYGGFFKCANYAQQLYWLYDQNFDAPDLGGALPALYSNYDVTFQKQFAGGYAMKLTPFYRLGVDVPSFALVTSLAAGSAVFTANNQGVSRTSGVEFGFNTPERPYGFTGFLSATYQNVLSTTPPLIGGEDALPINGSGSLILGDTYRAGYISPFTMRIGGEYKTHNGFRINPVIEYDRGYPFNVGNTIASSGTLANGLFANVPQVNFGVGTTQIPGYQAQVGTADSTNYYDPSFSGTSQNPNIAGTRGTPGTASSGGALFHANVYANLTVEYKKSRNTLGVQVLNLFGNAYNGSIPIINPYYQPVATGLSGPQTGINPFTPTTTGRGLQNGFANEPKDAYAYTNGAYLLLPIRPLTFTVYYQLGL